MLTNHAIHWMVIYSVDSVIHLSNNPDLINLYNCGSDWLTDWLTDYHCVLLLRQFNKAPQLFRYDILVYYVPGRYESFHCNKLAVMKVQGSWNQLPMWAGWHADAVFAIVVEDVISVLGMLHLLSWLSSTQKFQKREKKSGTVFRGFIDVFGRSVTGFHR